MDTKPIIRHFFGLEVRVDRGAADRGHVRVLNDGEVRFSRECPSVPEAIDAGYLYACHHRPIELRIRDPERGQTDILNPGKYRLEFKGMAIYQSPLKGEVEEAEAVFRTLQRGLWERQAAEHQRQREQLPGRKIDLEAQIADLGARIAILKEEQTEIHKKLTALDPYKASVTDDTVAELGSIMARRVAGDRLTGELADGTPFDEETGEVVEQIDKASVPAEALKGIEAGPAAVTGPRQPPKRGGR